MAAPPPYGFNQPPPMGPPPPGYHGSAVPPVNDPYGYGAPPPAPSYYGQAGYSGQQTASGGYSQFPDTGYKPDGDVESGHSDGFTATGFSNKALRAAFIRKVYFILSCQLSVTFGIVALFVFCDPVKQFIREYYYLYYLGYAVFLVTYIMLVCCKSVRRQFPTNLIMLSIFTLAMSYMVATISSFYDTKIIFLALGVTCGITFGVSLFACQTKFDFTKYMGILCVLSFGLFFFGIFTIFFYNNILQMVYGGIGALLFTLFLAVDTQLIIGGKRHELNPEDHILGAILLYIDVVYIFLFLLQLFGGGDR